MKKLLLILLLPIIAVYRQMRADGEEMREESLDDFLDRQW
jgi:hypothetical protein